MEKGKNGNKRKCTFEEIFTLDEDILLGYLSSLKYNNLKSACKMSSSLLLTFEYNFVSSSNFFAIYTITISGRSFTYNKKSKVSVSSKRHPTGNRFSY